MGSSSPQIKNFISTSYEYLRKRNDKNLMQIQRQLQILSVVADFRIFEPTCIETLEFYICLEKLLISPDPKSTLPWKVITLLNHLSQSQNIRLALRDDIKLVPVLSEYLIASKFSSDKTSKLLSLIDTISYKMKIPYAEAWMTSFVRYLTDMVKADSGDLFLPALSNLANLCRFNPPALTCLRSNALSKPLIQRLINMKNPTTKESLLAAEIMLYLDPDFSKLGKSPADDQVNSAVDCIIQAGREGFVANDVSCMQLAADVFAEFAACPNLAQCLRERDFRTFIEDTMKYLTEDTPESFVEVYLDLLFYIIDLDLPNLQPMYEDIFMKVTKWIPSELCCLPSLRVLRTLIMIDKKFIDSPQLKEFIDALWSILEVDEGVEVNAQKLQHINGVLILLEELCAYDTTLCMKLAMSFQAPKFNALLKLVIGIDSTSNFNETLCSPPDTNMNNTWRDLEFTTTTRVSKAILEDRMAQVVVHIMSVVKLLGSHNSDFVMEYDKMLNYSDTMKYIVHCERSSNPDLIAKAVTLLSNGNLSNDSMTAIVKAMEESNKYKTIKQDTEYSNINNSFTPDWEAKVDHLIKRLNGSVEKMELKDLSLTAVIDMYEYKFAAMVHAENTIQNALAAADTRYRQTHLSLLQTQAQTDQLRKLLSVWEERFCAIQQDKSDMQNKILEIQKSSKQLRDNLMNEKTTFERKNQALLNDLQTCKAEIGAREESIRKLQQQQQEYQAELKNLQRTIKDEQEKYRKSQLQVQKLEEDIKKGGKDYESLEKECQRLEKSLAEVKKENSELELVIQGHEETITSKEMELEQMTKSYQELKRIQDLIHNMSGKVNTN